MKKRPAIKKWKKPKHIKEYPVGPGFQAGHLVTPNAGWRTFKPVVDQEDCTGCGICCLLCPEGVMYKKDGELVIDYDFCKGCGICEHQCPAKAIKMIKEDSE